MKKKVKNILVIGLLIIGVIAICVGVFFLIMPSDKDVFTDALKQNVNNIKDMSMVGSDSEGIFTLKKDLKVKLSTDTKLTAGDNFGSLDGELYVDSYLKEIYGNLTTTGSGDKNFSIEAVLKDSKLYHKIKDVYSKFYYTDIDLSSLTGGTTVNTNVDTMVVFDYLQEAISKQLDKVEITKEDKTLTLDGDSINTKKYSAAFTEKDLYEILKNTLDKVNDNKDLREALASTFAELDTEFNFGEVINQLDELIKNADTEKTLLTYSICLDGKKVISNDFAISMEVEGTKATIRLVINSYENKNGFDNLDLYVSAMGIKIVNLEVRGKSEIKSEFSLNIANTFDISGTVESTDTKFDLSIKAYMTEGGALFGSDESGEKQEVFSMNLSSLEVAKDKEYDVNLELNMNIDDEEFNIKSTNKLVVVDKIPEIDLSDSAEISEMTEEEKKVYDSLFGGLSNELPSLTPPPYNGEDSAEVMPPFHNSNDSAQFPEDL